MEPNTKLFPAVFVMPSSQNMVQFELGKLKVSYKELLCLIILQKIGNPVPIYQLGCVTVSSHASFARLEHHADFSRHVSERTQKHGPSVSS